MKQKDVLTIVLLISGLIFLMCLFKAWELPVTRDRSFYIYNSQEIARGRLPYVDFFDIHPPAAWILSAIPMRLFPKLSSGAGPVYILRIWTLIWTILATVALYCLASRLTGRWLGGFLASFFFAVLTPHVLIYSARGETKLLVVAAIVTAAALMQRDRWLLAGLAVGIGSMAYYPALLSAVGALILLTDSKGNKRWRNVICFITGITLPAAFILLWLARHNALAPWFDTTLRWIFVHLAGKTKSVLGNLGSINTGKLHFPGYFNKVYPGKGILLPALAFLSYTAFVLMAFSSSASRQSALGDRKALPLALISFFYALFVLMEHGPSDLLIITPFVAVWAAWGITLFMRWIEVVHKYLWRSASVLLALLLISAMVRTTIRVSHKTRGQTDLRSQIMKAEAVDRRISPDRRLLVMGELWPLVLSGRENASPFYHYGPKMNLSARSSSRVKKNILTEVVRAGPELVLLGRMKRRKKSDRYRKLFRRNGYLFAGKAGSFDIFIPRGDKTSINDAAAVRLIFNKSTSEAL